LVPTLFLGSALSAATLVPPSATNGAINEMTSAGVGCNLFIETSVVGDE
jgi:hypothetical protein